METTDSSEGVPMERSYSNCVSAASSGLVQMNSSSSSVPMDRAAPQPRLDIPCDIGAASSSNDEAESAGEHYAQHRVGVMLSPVLTPGLSGRNMSNMVTVQSEPTFSVYHSCPVSVKDAMFTMFNAPRMGPCVAGGVWGGCGWRWVGWVRVVGFFVLLTG